MLAKFIISNALRNFAGETPHKLMAADREMLPAGTPHTKRVVLTSFSHNHTDCLLCLSNL